MGSTYLYIIFQSHLLTPKIRFCRSISTDVAEYATTFFQIIFADVLKFFEEQFIGTGFALAIKFLFRHGVKTYIFPQCQREFFSGTPKWPYFWNPLQKSPKITCDSKNNFFLKTLDVSKSLSSKQMFHGTFCSCAFEA